ncbi:uncharacterized protein LOC104872897 [Fukomys damarensis]|uniref:uncharacterized protein LOC104872897 n=1 Tax=Fukomys damarensis TaxID=885580 RepID=UPI0014551C99|nr:uncharacterized protein LOC104872897 [Fukomys damarensis]
MPYGSITSGGFLKCSAAPEWPRVEQGSQLLIKLCLLSVQPRGQLLKQAQQWWEDAGAISSGHPWGGASSAGPPENPALECHLVVHRQRSVDISSRIVDLPPQFLLLQLPMFKVCCKACTPVPGPLFQQDQMPTMANYPLCSRALFRIGKHYAQPTSAKTILEATGRVCENRDSLRTRISPTVGSAGT